MEEAKNETKEQVDSNVQLLENTEEITNEEQVISEEKKDTVINSKNKKRLIIVITSLVVIIIILSTIFAIINIWNTKIIKGIYIGRIDVSNKTTEEAETILSELCNAKEEKQIYLIYDEYETAITYKALEVDYQIKNAVKEAYNVGRTGNIFKNNIDILGAMIKGHDVDLEAVIDADMISQISQNINNNIKDAVTQPSYYIEKDKLIITSGKKGLKVDEKQLLEDIYKVINMKTEDEQTITIPMVMSEPEKIDVEKIHQEIYKEVKDAYYTKEPFTIYPEIEGVDFNVEEVKKILEEEQEKYEIQLTITKPKKTVNQIGTEAFPDLIATFSTKYNAGNKNRTINLQLAAKKIDGVVLLPGEEFSYNKVVGERTIQAGYKEAAVYSAGQVVDGIGGGICQISSTLYDAVIMANLNVTTRRNHQFVTSYLPAGKDATVVWGSQDFKFVNTRKNPIKIEAKVSGGVAKISIWSVKEDVEYDISIETKKIATIAYTTQYIEDPNLPVGQQKIVQEGSNGSKVEAYKVVKLNGKVISRTLLSKDTYNAMKQIVHVGTLVQ